MKKRNDVPPSSVSEAAPVDALTAMTLERDKALAMAQRIGDQSDQRIAKLLDKLSVMKSRAEAAEATVATLTQERDHERHEKETISDAMQAYARWSRSERGRLEATITTIHTTMRGDEKAECWTIRKWLDERGVFNDDIQSRRRLVEAACTFALAVDAEAPSHPAPATQRNAATGSQGEGSSRQAALAPLPVAAAPTTEEEQRSEDVPPFDWTRIHPAIKGVTLHWLDSCGSRTKFVHREARGPVPEGPLPPTSEDR